MSIDIPKAVRLMKAVQLQTIRLIEGHAKADIPFGVTLEGVAADIKFGGKALPQPAPDSLVIHAAIEVSVRPAESTEPVVTMSGTFELHYTIPTDTSPTQEELAAFAGTNAVFNAWPFWREYVQSTFLRMNLPPLLLPVFRLEDAGKELQGMPSRERAKVSAGQEAQP